LKLDTLRIYLSDPDVSWRPWLTDVTNCHVWQPIFYRKKQAVGANHQSDSVFLRYYAGLLI